MAGVMYDIKFPGLDIGHREVPCCVTFTEKQIIFLIFQISFRTSFRLLNFPIIGYMVNFTFDSKIVLRNNFSHDPLTFSSSPIPQFILQ